MMPEDRDRNPSPPKSEVKIRVIEPTGSAPRQDVSSSDWMDDEGTSEEEVIRLESGQSPPIARPVAEVELAPAASPAPAPAPAYQEPETKGITHLQVTLWMAGVVAVLVVAGVFTVHRLAGNSTAAASALEAIEVNRELDRDDEAETQVLLGQLEEVYEVLRKYVAAEKPADVLPLIRDREPWNTALDERWEPFDFDLDAIPSLQIMWLDTEEYPCLSLAGLDREGVPFQLIFIELDGRMVLDWGASFGIGEVPFQHLSMVEPGASVVMRVLLEPDNFYNTSFPEQEFMVFKMLPYLGPDWAWAYVRRGTKMESELFSHFRGDSYIFKREARVPVIVELRKPEQGEKLQFEIVKLLSKNWIR
ncbi:MAG: hypothetical protein ACQKBU_00530 [Verrucomicrobiales bacterium]